MQVPTAIIVILMVLATLFIFGWVLYWFAPRKILVYIDSYPTMVHTYRAKRWYEEEIQALVADPDDLSLAVYYKDDSRGQGVWVRLHYFETLRLYDGIEIVIRNLPQNG